MDSSQIFLNGLKRKNKMIIKWLLWVDLINLNKNLNFIYAI